MHKLGKHRLEIVVTTFETFRENMVRDKTKYGHQHAFVDCVAFWVFVFVVLGIIMNYRLFIYIYIG